MRLIIGMLVLAVAFLRSVAPLSAQTADPSGHWKGAVHAPFGDVNVEIDLAAADSGALAGTFTNPSEQINGLPLSSVVVEGRSVRLEIKTGTSGQMFKGQLSANGQSISGDFLVSVYAVPFSLIRTGDARIETAPRSPAIDRALEGTWRGSLEIEGRSLALALTLTNHDDGTATGSWAIEGGVRVPVTIASRGADLRIGSKVTVESYTGTINADGTEIVGTFTEKALELPITFRRSGAQ